MQKLAGLFKVWDVQIKYCNEILDFFTFHNWNIWIYKRTTGSSKERRTGSFIRKACKRKQLIILVFNILLNPNIKYFVSVLGRDEGYTVKYTPSPEGVPKGKGVFLTVYPESSPIMDSI